MNSVKRTMAAVLSAALLLLGMAMPAAAEEAWLAGTYSATAEGYGGEVTVTMTVEESGIVDVAITGEKETAEFGGKAMPKLAEAMLTAQSAQVDGVTGATMTSRAALSAAKSCVAQAHGAAQETTEVKMAPGTYTASAWGFSQVRQVPVTVTVDETNILSIEVDKEAAAETTHLLQTAIDLMIPRMIEHNSLAVDAITGATASSNAVKTAVADCVAQALEAAGTPESAIDGFYTELDLATNETKEIDVDVVVVGMGGTGTAAAMHTAELQAQAGKEVSVLALEKAGSYGGTSSATTSLLGFNSVKSEELVGKGVTDVDMRASHRDTEGADISETFMVDLEEIRAYLTAQGILGAGNKYAEWFWDHGLNDSGAIVDWLIGHGFYFGAPRLGFWGDWHTQFYYCDGAGEANLQKIHDCFDLMVADYEKLGGKYMLETEGYELIYDAEANKVTGVKARNLVDGTEYVIHANAVIMATGGFGGNSEMMIKYNDGDYWLLGMTQNDGKMIESAIEIGAGTLGMNTTQYGGTHNVCSVPQLHVFDYHFDESGAIDIWRDDIAAWSLNDVPNIIAASFDSMWVTTEGKRVVNEDMMWAWPIPGATYYTIVNQDWIDNVAANGFARNNVELFCNAGYATFPLNTPIPEMGDVLTACEEAGILTTADTIEELAQKLGMDPAVLAETYATYNTACKTGEDALGKAKDYLVSIDGGKLYAFHSASRPYSSVGGLDVTDKLEVVKADGETVIGGLYCGGTDCLGAAAPAFGGELQLWAYMSGYYAAEAAADYVAAP